MITLLSINCKMPYYHMTSYNLFPVYYIIIYRELLIINSNQSRSHGSTIMIFKSLKHFFFRITVLEKRCRDHLLDVQTSINQTLTGIVEVIGNIIGQIQLTNPEIPDDLSQNLTSCLEAVVVLFNRTLELTEKLEEVTSDSDTTALCPVEEFEELLEDLGAKLAELESYESVIRELPPVARRRKRVAGMDILLQLQAFHRQAIEIRIVIIVVIETVVEKFAEIEMEENTETSEIMPPPLPTTTTTHTTYEGKCTYNKPWHHCKTEIF